ncbi:MAG: Maf family nucleotide pyrophosphatase [Planctomycetaceae bacterium]|nr:Maf family nucleotide pyrophosphatase [Planctomycetaceae bacterium]
MRAFLLLIFLSASVVAADIPHAPHMAAGASPRLVAGVQTEPGGTGVFQLFSIDAATGRAGAFGRYNGQLTGLALDPDGMPLVLTRDGALNRLGDDAASLALPDARWNMAALAWWDGDPFALHHEDGAFYEATVGDGQEWTRSAVAVAAPGAVARAELVPLGGDLHLLWSTRDNHLGDGLMHHAVRDGGGWRELEPIPVGGSDGFAVYADGDELHLAAIVPDPLRDAPPRIASLRWTGGAWRRTAPPAHTAERLAAALGVAAAAADGQTFWLATSMTGATLWRDGSDEPAQTLVQGMPSGFDWSRLTGLVTFAALAALFIIYCRRSRVISRNFPARPADLISRGAALGIDWLIASFAMGVYHVASGDIYILTDLISLGDIQDIFWINLLGLAVFMGITEGMFGCTPGKYLAGLRVRSVLGGPPTLFQAAVRNLFRGIDMYPLGIAFPGLVGAIATFFNPKRQRVGDVFAGTVVRRHAPIAARPFFLASASPRRLELLSALVGSVRTEAMDVDEEPNVDETPLDTALRLAQTKAKAAANAARPAEIVVAADTVVALDGKILGKPVDAADAARMLERLSGRSHTVVTGLAVWDSATGQALSDVEETEVEFRNLTAREIADYVASGDPMDKAGAYGVQTGFLVKQVRGSLSNVAGLPMEKLQSMLMTLDS